MFLAVSRAFRGIMGCSRGVGAVPGCSRGVPVMFQAVLGVFRGVSGCSGFYRHPSVDYIKVFFNITQHFAILYLAYKIRLTSFLRAELQLIKPAMI